MEKVGFIDDVDFGTVDVLYDEEQKVLIADGLLISNVPEDFRDKEDDIMSAWGLFKRHYQEYGALALAYEQIPYGDSLFD